MTTTYNEYLKAAALAQEVEIQMLDRLEVVALRPKQIAIIGFGTESTESLVKARYPEAEMIRMDFTEQMLEEGWALLATNALPLADKSVDIIISNLFLPWCAYQEKIFLEWQRILRPEGLLMFTSLGPDTLCEWQDQSMLIPNRYDMHDVGDALVRAGFSDPVLDVEQYLFRYQDADKLQHELKITGMMKKDAREIFSKEITYEVVYAHTWGQVIKNEGIIKIPLEKIGGRTKG